MFGGCKVIMFYLSSRQSLSSVKSGRAESRSREDITANIPPNPTPTHHTAEQSTRRASFLEVFIVK